MLTRVLVVSCLLYLLPSSGSASDAPTDTGEAGAETFTFRLWFCSASDKGAGMAAMHLCGDLDWDDKQGALRVRLEPSQRLFWIPGESAKKEGLPCPLRDFEERRDVSLRRGEGNVWRVEADADAQSNGGSSAAEDADMVMFGLGPLLFPALEHRSQLDAADMGADVVSRKDPGSYVVNPRGVWRLTKHDEETLSSEVAYIREAYATAEVVFAQVSEDEIRAVTAHIWTGGVGMTPEEKARAAEETMEKTHTLLGMDWGGEDLHGERLKAFLGALLKSHPGNNVSISILEMRPAAASGASRAKEVADAKHETD